MIQRDVIQRLIHQISAVLARMIGKNVGEQLIILEEYLQQHHGLSIEELDKISDENLIQYLSDELQLNPYQIESIAGVMNARGDVFVTDDKKEKAKQCFNRALLLLDYVNTETATFSFDRSDLIDNINNKLKTIL